MMAGFRVLKLGKPHLQNLPRGYPAVAVLFDDEELLRIGQAGRNYPFSRQFSTDG